MDYNDKHFKEIIKIYPDAIDFHRPAVEGITHDVYIVQDCNKNKFICRFTDKQTALHNIYVCNQMQHIGLTVPDVSVHNIDGQYIETYPFIKGKTFYERLTEGMPTENQDKIYEQLFDILHKISQIPYNPNFELPLRFTAKCQRAMFKLLGAKNRKIYHTDLNTKNVILDDQDNVHALIDLDAIYPEYFSLLLIYIIRDAELYGYDINKLKKFYNPDVPDGMNLEKQLKIYRTIQKTFRFFVNDSMYKQLLKIKVK